MVERSSSISKLFTSTKRDIDTDSLLPSAAAQLQPLCGEVRTVCPLHTRKDQTHPQQLPDTDLHTILLETAIPPGRTCSFLISPLLSPQHIATPCSAFHEGCDTVQKNSAFRSELTFITSLKASCNTLRKSQQLHFDPKRMAVMVRSGSLTHRSRRTRLWCSK